MKVNGRLRTLASVPTEKEYPFSLEWWAGWAPAVVWTFGVVKNTLSFPGIEPMFFWSCSAYVGIHESD